MAAKNCAILKKRNVGLHNEHLDQADIEFIYILTNANALLNPAALNLSKSGQNHQNADIQAPSHTVNIIMDLHIFICAAKSDWI